MFRFIFRIIALKAAARIVGRLFASKGARAGARTVRR